MVSVGWFRLVLSRLDIMCMVLSDLCVFCIVMLFMLILICSNIKENKVYEGSESRVFRFWGFGVSVMFF